MDQIRIKSGSSHASRQLGHLADNFGGTLAVRRAVTFRGWRAAIVAGGVDRRVDRATRETARNEDRNGVCLRYSCR